MNAFKAAVLLLITLNLAKAQTGCVPPGSDSDLQLLPGCTSNEILEKVFSGLKKILTEEVGANKEDCMVGLQQTLNETADFVLKCFDGVCNDNLLYQVLKELNHGEVASAKLVQISTVKEYIKYQRNLVDDYLAQICPIKEKFEKLMKQLETFLKIDDIPKDIKELIQTSEKVFKMLLRSKDAFKTKSVGVSKCDFFKNQTSFLMDTDSISAVNSTISMFQQFQNLPFGSVTKLYKKSVKEVKAQLDMLGCSLNNGFLPAVPNIVVLVLMIFANFL